MRSIDLERNTKETQIKLSLNLDGSGSADLSVELPFFAHMLDQLVRHGDFDLQLNAIGDLEIDAHHTVEDIGIILGEAFNSALGDKKGIKRFGSAYAPLDESLSRVVVDFSGRPGLFWDVEFKREMVGDLPTEMVMHFFKSFSDASKCNLNVSIQGDNEHHKIEAIFKATAKAIKMAVTRKIENKGLPTTKGLL